MQKSIVVSTPEAEFSALAFKEDFKESIKKVAKFGFDAVELAVRNPENIDIVKTKEVLEEYNLSVPAIGTGQAYGEEGLSFTNPDKEIREQAVERIKAQMDFSEQIGDPQIIIGLIRGIMDEDQKIAEAEKYFLECLRKCADYKRNIILTLEPINRYETNLYNTIESMKGFISKVDRDNVKLLVDTFHMNIEEPDIYDSIKNSAQYISHVHVADSNRWAPGCGHLDFEKIIETLKDIDYDGALSAEILPKPDPDKSAELTMKCFEGLGI